MCRVYNIIDTIERTVVLDVRCECESIVSPCGIHKLYEFQTKWTFACCQVETGFVCSQAASPSRSVLLSIERPLVLSKTSNSNARAPISVKPIVRPMQPVVSQAPGYLIELQCYVEANPFPTPDQLMWRKGTRAMSVNSGRWVRESGQGARGGGGGGA